MMKFDDHPVRGSAENSAGIGDKTGRPEPERVMAAGRRSQSMRYPQCVKRRGSEVQVNDERLVAARNPELSQDGNRAYRAPTDNPLKSLGSNHNRSHHLSNRIALFLNQKGARFDL